MRQTVASDLALLGIVVVAAAVARGVARGFAIPPVAGFIVAGLAVRFLVAPEAAAVEPLLFVSLAFLLFAAGARTGPQRFDPRSLRPALLVGLLVPMLVGGGAFAVTQVYAWSVLASMFAAVAVGASSTLVVFAILVRRGEMDHPHGRLLVRALLLQDMGLVVLLSLLPSLGNGATALLLALRGLAILVGLTVLIGLLVRLRAVWRFASDAEGRTLAAFALGLGGMLVAARLGLPSPVGAFLAGLVLSTFPANVQTRPALQAARDFFTPIFFVTLALSFPLPGSGSLPLVAGLLVLLLVLKPVLTALMARVSGHTVSVSAETGLLAGQGSEFGIVLVLSGLALDQLSPEQAGVLWVAIAASMLATTVLPRRTAQLLVRGVPRERPPRTLPQEGHVVVLGAGVGGCAAIEAVKRLGRPVVAVDLDPTVQADRAGGVPLVVGDAEDPRVLDAARVSSASAVLSFLKSDRATVSVFRSLEERIPMEGRAAGRVHSHDAAVALTAMGVVPVRAGEALERALGSILDEIDERPG